MSVKVYWREEYPRQRDRVHWSSTGASVCQTTPTRRAVRMTFPVSVPPRGITAARIHGDGAVSPAYQRRTHSAKAVPPPRAQVPWRETSCRPAFRRTIPRETRVCSPAKGWPSEKCFHAGFRKPFRCGTQVCNRDSIFQVPCGGVGYDGESRDKIITNVERIHLFLHRVHPNGHS